jgi:GT2 family glycosyltransferase
VDATPLISAVVLCFNSARYIEACVRALDQAFTELGQGGEILVVENGSHDDSARRLRALEDALGARLQVEYLARNCGTTVSRNMALRRARGRYLLVLDSDAVASAATLRHLVRVLETDPSIGIIVPKLVYPDGRFQLSCDRFPTVGRKLERLWRLRGLEAEAAAPPGPEAVDYAISAFWLMPRATFERVGPLDERIFYSPEDVDYCLRVWQAGLRVVWDPRVCAVHDAQEISRGRKISRFAMRHAAGLAYYFWKHRYCLSVAGLYKRLPGRT